MAADYCTSCYTPAAVSDVSVDGCGLVSCCTPAAVSGVPVEGTRAIVHPAVRQRLCQTCPLMAADYCTSCCTSAAVSDVSFDGMRTSVPLYVSGCVRRVR